ncbi:MAG: hypothetical protein ACQEW9_15895 [Bacteroidota bacterium]
MEIITKDAVVYKRRIIQIFEGSKYEEFLTETVGSIFPYSEIKKIPKRDFYENLPISLKKKLRPIIKYPFVEIDYAFNNFKFPPQHPIEGLIYCCSDFESNYYMPLNEFHSYSLKLKESAFIEMCAHLGAKEIVLIDENINDKKTDLNLNLNLLKFKAGANYSENETSQINSNFIFRFPKPKCFKNENYENNWIESEPSWNTLQKLRINNDLKEYVADFSYTDEMGITASLAAKIVSFGLEIGGSFKEIKKVNRKYSVTFWEKN